MMPDYLTPPNGKIDTPGSGRGVWDIKPSIHDGPRDKPIMLRATALELDRVKQAAQDSGRTLTEYIRQAIHDSLSASPPAP
jgi:mobilization protein NikA